MNDRVPVPGYITDYWGKAQPTGSGGPQWHPLVYHMLDVAAVAQSLLRARPHSLSRATDLLGLSDEAVFSLLPLVAALHDLGKFARGFQSKVPAHWTEGRNVKPTFSAGRRHDADGWLIWHGSLDSNDGIIEEAPSIIWPGAGQVLDTLMGASVAHHGRPVSSKDADENLKRAFGPGESAARAFTRDVIQLLLPIPIAALPPKDAFARRTSFWLAGFITLADWVGSNMNWFPYTASDQTLAEYWLVAQKASVLAIGATGLGEAAAASGTSFVGLTGIRMQPSPMQAWAETAPLPDGPCLILIEDVTGAGKTEAAQMLVHRLMASGRASGAYWAMPTQATANAMYERQRKMIASLFASGTNPRLALAHGQARLSDAFQASIRRGCPDISTYGDDEQTATASCTEFLADDKRAALVADIGAGTIDQALLGALPSKFNTVRLFGLTQKVLVLDEAHAYDSYVQAETEGLLRFQAALGGAAIILSATLPLAMRRKFVKAWQEGAASTLRPSVASLEYPLVTAVAPSSVDEVPVCASSRSRRTVPVRLVHNTDDALSAVVAASKAGGAVAWIRNTVDDALAAAASLRELGASPLVFHARFAQCDRQYREQEVLRIFGKDGGEERRGRVLVATQVVEQSLDLDFDCMVTDLAPVDLLIQRAGRLHRHPERIRPAKLPLELIVLSPEPVEAPSKNWIESFLPGTAAVYRNANILWRTARKLASSAIVTPDGLRDLVEYVYDENCEVPEALIQPTLRSEGDADAARSLAQQNRLNPANGYRGGQVQWEDERKISTRLIDNQTTVRLARLDELGSIIPYADHPEQSKAWALSEVRVRSHRIPADAQPPPQLSDAVARVRAQWTRYDQDTPLIVLEPNVRDCWTGLFSVPKSGVLHQVIYSEESGLGEITPT